MICFTHRQSQLNIGWTEVHCARLDEISAGDHSYIATAAERARRENTWVLVLNSSGPNGPMSQRVDYEDATNTCQRLYQESGQAHHRLHLRDKSIATRQSICLARRRFGARRPEDRLGVHDTQQTPIRPSSGGDVCVVAVFFMAQTKWK